MLALTGGFAIGLGQPISILNPAAAAEWFTGQGVTL